MIALLFLSYGLLIVRIGSGMATQQSFFVKHVQTVSIQVCHSLYTEQCGCILFLCCESPPAIMQHKQRLLGQNQFDMFYTKKDCCAAIHGQI